MDKKLIAAFTFGLLAVSVANLLLSVGIVSLILTQNPGSSGNLPADTGTFPGALTVTRKDLSLDSLNNTTATNMTRAAVTMTNATATPPPAVGMQSPAGMSSGSQFTPPSGGQFTPPSGMSPPSGQWSGQAPPSGQMPSGAAPATVSTGQASPGTGQVMSATQQAASGNSPLPYNMSQYMSGSGTMPVNTLTDSGEGYIPVPVASLTDSQSKTTPTPKPSSLFSNFSSLWSQ